MGGWGGGYRSLTFLEQRWLGGLEGYPPLKWALAEQGYVTHSFTAGSPEGDGLPARSLGASFFLLKLPPNPFK